jgi:pimeloyl-ACP methyl ester carboxylesterase
MTSAFEKRPVSFTVKGDLVRGDLYLPATREKAPVVIMAHGFGGERRFRLPAFAEYFAARGLAVVLFDYRGFGDSAGEPRAFVDAPRHLEDYAGAVAFARRCPDVDGTRVGLWGTSYSGGHVLVTAARDQNIRVVVSQVPHVDGLASAMGYPPLLLPKASWLAAQDLLSAARGGEPVRMPIVAEEGVRALATPDCYDGYTSMIPAGADWVNAVPARILFTIMAYRPVTEVQNINCPVLLVASPTDTLIPFSATKRAVAKIRDCRLELIEGGHFDPYLGDCFDKVVRMECDFLCSKLGVTA